MAEVVELWEEVPRRGQLPLWRGPRPFRMRGWPKRGPSCWLLLMKKLMRQFRGSPSSRVSLWLHTEPET
jgi:hypothetical protein